jgi:hypothetical protein
VCRFHLLVLNARPQPGYHLTRNEDHLSIFAALWALDGKLLVGYIFGGELQDFTDSHAASGYQFQYESVSQLRSSEDDLIDRLLFDYIPVDGLAGPVQSSQHRDIYNGRIKPKPAHQTWSHQGRSSNGAGFPDETTVKAWGCGWHKGTWGSGNLTLAGLKQGAVVNLMGYSDKTSGQPVVSQINVWFY